MNIDAWDGAQWVLAMWLAFRVTIFPMFGLAAKYPSKWTVWIGEYLAKVVSCATLTSVLWWGGFWQ